MGWLLHLWILVVSKLVSKWIFYSKLYGETEFDVVVVTSNKYPESDYIATIQCGTVKRRQAIESPVVLRYLRGISLLYAKVVSTVNLLLCLIVNWDCMAGCEAVRFVCGSYLSIPLWYAFPLRMILCCSTSWLPNLKKERGSKRSQKRWMFKLQEMLI